MRNPTSAIALSLALFFALLIAPMRASADELDDLSKAVTAAEKEFSEAVRSENAALTKVEENGARQKKAKDAGQDAEFKRLKSEGVKLSVEANAATNTRLKAEAKLAQKRSELRSAASKVAEDQITAATDVNTRTKRAGEAMEKWRGALGDLRQLPAIRDTQGVDEDEAKAMKRDDKARLTDYSAWAKEEQSKVETELKRAENLVNNEAKFKGADGYARIVSDAKSLKESLDNRLSQLKESQKTARERITRLDK